MLSSLPTILDLHGALKCETFNSRCGVRRLLVTLFNPYSQETGTADLTESEVRQLRDFLNQALGETP